MAVICQSYRSYTEKLKMFRYINKHILTGLITILPLMLTAYLVYGFVVTTEAFLGGLIRAALSEDIYRPGLGVVAGLLVAFIVGLLLHTLFVPRRFYRGARIGSHLPLLQS